MVDPKFIQHSEHRDLVEEYEAIESAEERLEWLMERPPLHPAVPLELITDERRVPGCLSGLWLHGSSGPNGLQFSAKSDSSMVQGIASFICDLYSNRSAMEILEVSDTLVQLLNLERLLSLTRKRAVSSTVAFVLHTAREGQTVRG